MNLPIRQLDPDLPPPSYANPDDAGLDLRTTADVHLEPGERAIVGTGIAVAIPPGHVGLIHPRSGLAARHGITVVNAPGTIDAGYRGELMVILLNTDRAEAWSARRGDRIAQLILQRVSRPTIDLVDDLDVTDRGTGGLGSSGTA